MYHAFQEQPSSGVVEVRDFEGLLNGGHFSTAGLSYHQLPVMSPHLSGANTADQPQNNPLKQQLIVKLTGVSVCMPL